MARTRSARWIFGALPHYLFMLGAVILALLVSQWLIKPTDVQSPSEPVRRAGAETAIDRQIAQLQDSLRRQPSQHDANIKLGGAYLQKARQTGDASLYTRAEGLLGKALEINPESVPARTLLGAVAVGRHRFADGAAWANAALRRDPNNAEALGVLGDAQVELGQYDAAVESFQAMVNAKPNLDSYARVSYIRELMGDVDGAIEAMTLAVAASAPNTEPAAWARVQLGNLHFNAGQIDAAIQQYEGALAEFKGHRLAQAALGNARAAQGRDAEAIALYQESMAAAPDPVLLARLGDLYARNGQPQMAQQQYDTVAVIAKLARANQVVNNRELALFYADHGWNLDEAVELARRELAERQDIYAYDTLLWALRQNGQSEEAATLIPHSLRLGTQDASLYYHAGKVYQDLGEKEKAIAHLGKAMELNPYFSTLFSADASKSLDELQRSGNAAQGGAGETP